MRSRAKKQYRIVGLAVFMFISVNLMLLRIVLRIKDQNVSYHRNEGGRPVILLWYPPSNLEDNHRADSDACGAGVDCFLSYDRSLLDESSAVVFHFDSTRLETMPTRRNTDQLYVWWSSEKSHKENLGEFDNFFNLTLTYRRDSSIYAPFGSTNTIIEELRRAQEFDVEALLRRKRKSRKLAAWTVNNCDAHRRMALAKEMMTAGLDVDTFGRCFDDREIGDGENTESFYYALSDYKFYLAFESGFHCKDYITKNFWYNSLRSGAVPVVWGPKKEDVEAVAPKNSFIHVDDFKSVPELVNYMIQLSVNDEEYRKYLNWRTWVANPKKMEDRFRVDPGKRDLHSFCKLCKVIKDHKSNILSGKRKTMIVPSLRQWWWKRENKECLQSDFLDFEEPQDGVREILAKIPGLDVF